MTTDAAPNHALQRRPRSAVLMVIRNAARGPAERGRWAPRPHWLTSGAALARTLAWFALVSHSSATRRLRLSPNTAASATPRH